MKDIRAYIRQVLTEAVDTHRCLDGASVPIESFECYDDVCVRIEDATASRDEFPLQSDARTHYNGLLKVLRRKKRKAKRFMDAAV